MNITVIVSAFQMCIWTQTKNRQVQLLLIHFIIIIAYLHI